MITYIDTFGDEVTIKLLSIAAYYAKDLMDKLTKLPPMDEVGFKQKLNELIAGYTKGKDEGKLRIIVK